MSETSIDSGTSQELSAYQDGELRGLARWRLERRLRREPGLRRELAALARVGELVRSGEAAAEPDLWDRIEQRLPAIDARRAEAESLASRGAGAWWRPLGAVTAAAAALVVAVYVGLFEPSGSAGGVVRWMDSGGRSVLVVDDADADVTIIWLLDDAVEGAARGGSGEVA